jgi:hypothetical protein
MVTELTKAEPGLRSSLKKQMLVLKGKNVANVGCKDQPATMLGKGQDRKTS